MTGGGKAATGRGDMTLVEHLEELRWRLVIAVAAISLGTLAGWRLAPRLLIVLLEPARAAGAQLIQLAPAELFWVYMKLALLLGLILSAPVVVYQVLAFLWPGLTRPERRYTALLLPAAFLFFAAGVAFAYVFFLAFLFRFFLGFTAPGVTPTFSVGSYVSFVLNLLLPFGLTFQFPVLLYLLGRLGLVTAPFLVKNRKYAVLLIFIAAAVLTPPDPFSQIIMAVPLFLLYELGIVLVRWAGRARARTEALANDAGAG